jgi:hypothetical protein
LGTSALRFSTVYAASGTINTSDSRLKTDIAQCPLGLDFINSLYPKIYRWRSGGTEVSFEDNWEDHEEVTADGEVITTRTRATNGTQIETTKAGKRHHLGFIAQDVKASMDAAGVDCGLWVLDDKADSESIQSLRYEQMIAPLVTAIQELSKRIQTLEAVAR